MDTHVAFDGNGILKEEFGLNETFECYQNLKKQTEQSIRLYNELRPHLSIEMKTPNQAHDAKQLKPKQWKKSNRKKNVLIPI